MSRLPTAHRYREYVSILENARAESHAIVSQMKLHEMQNHVAKLAPSILAAHFAHVDEQVVEAERSGADRIHVAVMDGLVPNIAIGTPIVKSLRGVPRLPLKTHWMISDPDFFLDEFAEAGSDSFLVHLGG